MILSTTSKVYGKQIVSHIGFVRGATIHAKHVGRDIAASFKTLVGGEIKGYTEMMEEARKVAIGRMVEQAESLGANAIVGMRISSSAVMAGAAEIIAYGTAVVIE